MCITGGYRCGLRSGCIALGFAALAAAPASADSGPADQVLRSLADSSLPGADALQLAQAALAKSRRVPAGRPRAAQRLRRRRPHHRRRRPSRLPPSRRQLPAPEPEKPLTAAGWSAIRRALPPRAAPGQPSSSGADAAAPRARRHDPRAALGARRPGRPGVRGRRTGVGPRSRRPLRPDIRPSARSISAADTAATTPSAAGHERRRRARPGLPWPPGCDTDSASAVASIAGTSRRPRTGIKARNAAPRRKHNRNCRRSITATTRSITRPTRRPQRRFPRARRRRRSAAPSAGEPPAAPRARPARDRLIREASPAKPAQPSETPGADPRAPPRRRSQPAARRQTVAPPPLAPKPPLRAGAERPRSGRSAGPRLRTHPLGSARRYRRSLRRRGAGELRRSRTACRRIGPFRRAVPPSLRDATPGGSTGQRRVLAR